MSGITVNWERNRDWSEKDVFQLKNKENYITEGSGFDKKTKVFSVDFHKNGSMFSRASLPFSVVQNSAYVLAFPYHKTLTFVGKLGMGILESTKAKKFVKDHFMAARKDAALVLGSYAVSWFILGDDLYSKLSWGVTAAAISYAVYNPKGMKIHVADLEEMINAPALRDNEVLDLTDWQKAAPLILDGSYSLSRLLDMHRIGKLDEKLSGEHRFKTVEEKKKS